ncbi:hypothetical protein EDB81DRAFT_767516 [Dactylonectria macrodidyma]|uniref:Uncharacterized protein n=1 Tax=Dactylonectria macrodidyma TaxID=307937 RepID=A0A9P9ICA9_9HYPO|nr:hypothetical protein EDB81DRAFT_767516 [Dactylonectria macrodidyma]
MAIQRLARLNRGGRIWSIIRENWYLGFTSFGGPPVHFKISHDKFVTKLSWINEQVVGTYLNWPRGLEIGFGFRSDRATDSRKSNTGDEITAWPEGQSSKTPIEKSY